VGNAVNRHKSKTIGKHGEIVEKPFHKCISEGSMHVAASVSWNPRTKVHEIREI